VAIATLTFALHCWRSQPAGINVERMPSYVEPLD